MTNHAWAGRLANLVMALKPSDDLARFRNAYREAVSQGREGSGLSAEDAELLLEAGAHCESWIREEAGEPTLAWKQWLAGYAAANRLPRDPPLAFLRRLPKRLASSSDVVRFALKEANVKTIEVMLSKGLLKKSDLMRIARETPEDFYASPALDVALKRRLRLPRGVWDTYAAGAPRPKALISAEEALVLSYLAEKSPAAAKWIVQFMSKVPNTSRSIVTHILENREAAVDFIQHLTAQFWKGGKTKLNSLESSAVRVVADLVQVSQD